MGFSPGQKSGCNKEVTVIIRQGSTVHWKGEDLKPSFVIRCLSVNKL